MPVMVELRPDYAAKSKLMKRGYHRVFGGPKLNTIIEIDATRDDGNKITNEKLYYISSLTLRYARGKNETGNKI